MFCADGNLACPKAGYSFPFGFRQMNRYPLSGSLLAKLKVHH
jgi:hypothetical protein